MNSRLNRLEALFHDARALPREAREEFLSEVCGDDAPLAAEVRSLLALTGDANGFLDRPAVAQVAPLRPGTRLGAYDLKAFVGSGGMGDVYLARDLRLHRDVAVKVLPELFARDPARLARFDREARLLAQVNHPAVAAIYGCEHADHHHFLVLEYVPGETLADALATGPLGVDRAVSTGIQIARAVQAAHDRGIVHRDLKPANIKITPDGAIKVLDFGLARSTEPAGASTSDSPSGPHDHTASGVIMGTVAYMSPEQARGQPVDCRTDVWSFGCILFELLTGTRAFPGSTAPDTLVQVLASEPDWRRLPAATPSLARNVLRRCLRQDPSDRFQSLADARILLEDADRVPTDMRVCRKRMTPLRTSAMMRVAAATVVIAGVTAAATLMTGRSLEPTDGPRYVVPVTSGHLRGNEAMAISPDGARLAFAVQEGDPPISQLYVRSVNAFDATAVPGTRSGSRPFFSPDGQWIAFFTETELKKVAVGGGPAITICPVSLQWGGAWGPDDSIVFGGASGLWRVPAAGGTPTLLASDPENPATSYRWPQVLPDRSVLVTVFKKALQFDIAIVSQDGRLKTLVANGTKARFLPPQHLAFARESTLMTVAFDLARHAVVGEPAPALVGVRTDGHNGSAAFAVSASGTLAYNPGELVTISERVLVRVDRQGRAETLPFPPKSYVSARVSPDDRRFATVIDQLVANRLERDVWIGDLARGTLTRLSFESSVAGDVAWTPDSERVTYRRADGRLFWRQIGLIGPEEEVAPGLAVPRSESAGSWSPDGNTLIFSAPGRSGRDGQDLWTLSNDAGGAFQLGTFLATPFDELCPVFSPDGRWVSYIGHESGRPEIYVRPFPGPGPIVQVSREGGTSQHWSGAELIYLQPSPAQLMSAEVSAAGRFRAVAPQRFLSIPDGTTYSTAADGHRLLLFTRPAGPAPRPTSGIHVVTNWAGEVARHSKRRP